MGLRVGTLNYMAPEVFEGNYTSQCDLWSLGVIAYTLLSGTMPFTGDNGDDEMVTCIKEGSYDLDSECWSKVPEAAKHFISKLLTVDPEKRFTAEQALQDPWLVTARGSQVNADIIHALVSFSKASPLRRELQALMAWSLSNEERAAARAAFLELDEEHSGRIRFEELKHHLQTFGYSALQARRTFKVLQVSSDDGIHYSDFLAAMLSSDRIPIHDGLSKSLFRRIDTNNSGFIETVNLEALLGDRMDTSFFAQWMKDVDKDGDGRISMEEFVAYWHQPDDSSKYAAVLTKEDQIADEVDEALDELLPASKNTKKMKDLQLKDSMLLAARPKSQGCWYGSCMAIQKCFAEIMEAART
eukprot:TRINITY_DN78932_c0_g1_i1.p1 TRINITY_DN78932_c0_g1~~TRINITY_DN78932_c0_g1_i1.p1  ORF type:complete len:357 (+),score=73.32 TRINITY_DN78932_c0_g1_i1:3-1073(+)